MYFSRDYIRVFILVLFLTITRTYSVKVIYRSVRCYLTTTEHFVFLLFHSYVLVCEHSYTDHVYTFYAQTDTVRLQTKLNR